MRGWRSSRKKERDRERWEMKERLEETKERGMDKREEAVGIVAESRRVKG